LGKEGFVAGILDGKVAVVTNAGRGMGQEVALSMADEGARVVVHDSDGFSEKGGANSSLADAVAREIKERGGQGVACAASVICWEGSRDLVQTALEHFGCIDILVNHVDHRGIRLGAMLFDMKKEEWQSVVQAHLKAAFLCTRAALPFMRKQKKGRLIHFVSADAILGAVGHTHHGAAQMAVAGLSRNAAIEMDRYGVTSNCIVPCSKPGSDSEPADAAPLAVFLASDAAHRLSGQVFGVRGKEIFLFSQPRIQRSMHNSEGWTVERLSAVFESTMRPHFTSLESPEVYFSWDSTP
jgi:NAD(P)-dependent dehydrogenase (short-subunit alcohol dehydrogenase family)